MYAYPVIAQVEDFFTGTDLSFGNVESNNSLLGSFKKVMNVLSQTSVDSSGFLTSFPTSFSLVSSFTSDTLLRKITIR